MTDAPSNKTIAASQTGARSARPASDPVSDALSAMTAAGLNPGTLEFDDKIHRFRASDDKKGQRNGWYWAVHDDKGAVVVFGSWKSGSKHTWTSRGDNRIDPEQAKRLKRAQEQRRRADERRQKRMARRYAALYKGAAKADTQHAYLSKKSVSAYGLKQTGRRLLVPMRDAETSDILSLQAIAPNGFKRFARGGRVKGAYHGIGKPNGGRLIICEGYATGATLHEVTGCAVVVAFNANNLELVAWAMRKRFTQAEIIVAADNDQWTTLKIGGREQPNPGLYYAARAARAAGGRVALPIFSDVTGKPTDFNDLYHVEGADAVRRDIDRAPSEAEANGDQPAASEPQTGAAPEARPDGTPAPKQGDSQSTKTGPDITPQAAEQRDFGVDSQTPPQPVTIAPHGRAVDYVTPLPWANDKGKPKRHIDNLREICRRLGIVIRYNEITKEDEIIIPDKSFSVDNFYPASISWLESACTLFDMPHECVKQFITALSDENPYNPVRSWILSRPWDGEDRLTDFFATVTAAGEATNPTTKWLKEMLIYRWMVSACAAAFEPNGIASRGVLVFQGGQGLGKTNWFKNLVPRDLELAKDGMLLRPDNRDSVKQVCSFWLVELGELDATFRRSDIAALKSFISQDKDVMRRAFAVKENHYTRRTVFFASVNPKAFLHDKTGNTRYWTIECEDINHSHGLDVQQVWAQVYEQYRQGEPWYLTPEEQAALNDSNENFSDTDPIEERLDTRYDWTADEFQWRWMTATDVLVELGFDRPTRADATSCGTAVRDRNGDRSKRTGSSRYVLVPPLK